MDDVDDDSVHYIMSTPYRSTDIIMSDIEKLAARLHEAKDWQTLGEVGKIKHHLDELFKVEKL